MKPNIPPPLSSHPPRGHATRVRLLRVFVTLALLLGMASLGWGQISFVDSGSSSGATITIPSGWQANDLVLVFAFRNNNTTFPSLPTGFTNIATRSQTGGQTNISARLAYRVLQTGDGSSTFTFTNATETQVMILRGVDSSNPIIQFTGNGGDNTILNYAALASSTNSSSWIAGLGGHRNATNVYTSTVAGMTLRSASTVTKLGMHTMSGTTSFTSRNWGTVNQDSRWITFVAEVKEDSSPHLTVAPTSLAFDYVALGSTLTQNYNLSGSYLDGSSVTVSAPSGFKVSTDNTNFYSSLNVAYTAPTLNSTSIYVRFEPTGSPANYSGNVTNDDNGSAATVNVGVSGTSILSYCNSNFTNVSYEYISNVTFVGINNSSGGNTGGPVNYTNLVADVTQGNPYQISVTIDPDANDYIFGFFDWNQNGTLNDAGEVYTIASNTSSAGPHTLNITIPSGASLGNTRMRIMLVWNNSTPNPCLSATFGEAEDYTVNVLSPCTAPSGVTAGSNSPLCAGGTLNLTSGAASGTTPFTYSWTGPNSFTSSEQNPSITNATTAASGTYTVTISNSCGSANNATSVTVNPNPTLTGAAQAATVCAGSPATINLTGLVASSTSTVSYSINGTAQTPVANVVADGTGAASFSTGNLTFANNGQTLQITGITIISATPNCSASFTQNVTLSVNPNPTLTGAAQAATVCAGSPATINLTGLVASSTSTVSYSINGTAQTPVANVVADGTGAASFSTGNLTFANNGQTLQITGITITSATPNCSASFTQDVTLSVNDKPTIATISTPADICAGQDLDSTDPSVTNNGSTVTAEGWQLEDGVGAGTFSGITLPYTTALADNGKKIRYYATNGCGTSYSNEVVLTVNPLPNFSYTFTDVTCFGAGNGTITINASGGTTPYQYRYKLGAGSFGSWTSFNADLPGEDIDTEIINNLGPGIYTIEVRDANECTQVNCTGP